MKQLLLQAAQESSTPDAQSRVLALTSTGPLSLQADPTEDSDAPEAAASALVPLTNPGVTYLDSGLLSKARQILSRLENEDGDWADAFGEAQNSLSQLEQDLNQLESEASRPTSAAVGGREVAEEPKEASRTDLTGDPPAPFSDRLEDLHSQVSSML